LSALALVGTVAAQDAQRPIGGLLPATTVAAFHYTPGGPAAHDFLQRLAADLDLEAAKATLAKLGRIVDDELADLLDSGLDGMMGESFDEMLADLEEECPSLYDSVVGGQHGLIGPVVVGVSMSPFNPLPGVLAVARPSDTAAADRVYDALTACFDSGVSLKQDDVELHVIGDGGDQPIIISRVGSDFFASTDQDLVRGAIRLATGSTEPSHISRRVGGLAAGPMSRGTGMTLDLAALADALDGLRGFMPQEQAVTSVVDRVIATMRTINGVAVSARFDDAGLALETMVTVDEAAALAAGEEEFLALLTCAGCELGAPDLVPAGAASVWAGTFSATAFVDWLDSWLVDLAALGAGDVSVRSLVGDYLDIDLDAALLDWFGTGWHTAQLEVYDTDLRSLLQSPATVTVVPVASEAAAREGLVLWQQVVRSAASVTEELLSGAGLEDEAAVPVGTLDLLSVRPASYRGVGYERWRIGPTTDAGLLVIGGNLVIATPASAARDVIDVYLGGRSITSDPLLGPLLANQPAEATAYDLTDVPRYLHGFAELADLASAPMASLLQVALVAGLESSWTDPDGGSGDGASDIDPADIPTFEELLDLTDLGTTVLQSLALRSGVAIGTTEHVGGVIWSTWRLPLR
jgi:hypothetical protein